MQKSDDTESVMDNFMQRITEICGDLLSQDREEMPILEAPEVKDLPTLNGMFQAHLLIPQEANGLVARVEDGELCAVVGRTGSSFDVLCFRESGDYAGLGVAGHVILQDGNASLEGDPLMVQLEDSGIEFIQVSSEHLELVRYRLVEASVRTLFAWTIEMECQDPNRVLN